MSTRSAGALSGLLAALALPPFGLWPLVFSALVPLTLALSRTGLARRDVVGAGLGFGIVFYGVVLHWVPFTLRGLLPLGFLLGLLVLAVLAAVAGFQALVLWRFLSSGAIPLLAVPAVWAGFEFLLLHAGPLAFPWTPLGLALAAAPGWAGGAEWVGVGGLTVWIGVVNGAIVGVVMSKSGRGRALAAMAASVLVLGPGLTGLVRERTLVTRSLPPILLGQMAVGRDVLLRQDLRDPAAFASLQRIFDDASATAEEAGGWIAIPDGPNASSERQDARPTILILPEAPFASKWEDGVGRRVEGYARALGIPVLAGVRTAGLDEPTGTEEPTRNAAVLVPPDEEARLVHGKTRLVPGVEWPGFAPGPSGGVLSVGSMGIGVVICFESAFGSEAGRLRREGADLLVNPTNDAWFEPRIGGAPPAALAQYRAHLVLRAIETRMGAVRSSLGGENLVISPTGETLFSRPAGAEGIDAVRPLTSSVVSGYTRYGDLGGLAGVLLLIALAWRARGWRPVEHAPAGRYT